MVFTFNDPSIFSFLHDNNTSKTLQTNIEKGEINWYRNTTQREHACDVFSTKPGSSVKETLPEQNQAKATQLKKDSFHFHRRHRVNLGGSNFQGNLEDVQTFSPDRISYVLLLLKSFSCLLKQVEDNVCRLCVSISLHDLVRS